MITNHNLAEVGMPSKGQRHVCEALLQTYYHLLLVQTQIETSLMLSDHRKMGLFDRQISEPFPDYIYQKNTDNIIKTFVQ